MRKYNKYIDEAIKMGVNDAKIIPVDSIEISHAVRWKCKFGCEKYGKRLTCPPNVPSVDETKKMVDEFNHALLLHGHDNPEMQELVVKLEDQIFLDGYYKTLGLACGPCKKCDIEDCESPCPYPKKIRPSLEACGIDVYKTVRNNGYKIEVLQNEDQIPDYFAMVLIE